MAPSDFKKEKMSKLEARKRIRLIIDKFPGNIFFSKHSLEELKEDGLTTIDALNVLKSTDSKISDEGEFENGSYRYRVQTNYMMVVVSFSNDGNCINVVTAWDKRK